MYVGYPVNFAESIATIQSDLREIAPSVFLGVPRIWEKLQSAIYINIKDSSRLKRWLFKHCHAVGRRMAEQCLEGRPPSLGLKLAYWAAYWLMLRALQNFVGMRKSRFCFSAAAKVSPEVLRFFHDLGIRVKEGYGMTETTGLSFIHMDDDIRIGTVGKPIAGIEFAIADDGELLKRGAPVFVGYYKNDEATRQTVIDGWLHTGDIAEMDQHGHVCIVDRKKDIIITSGGKNIVPSEIENALKVSPYIKEAIVIGEGRNFIAALIQAEVDRVNTQFARVENVRKFMLLTKELDHDDDEITATMKVRRSNIYQKFAEEIEQVYGRG